MRYYLLLVLFVSTLVHTQEVLLPVTWKLAWEDHFDYYDSVKWMSVDWAQHDEPQLYRAKNVAVVNGNLEIKVDDNATLCPENPPTVWGGCWPCEANKTYNYTSGWIETTDRFSVQFGYIEARIKLPYEYGFWPAFWTYIAGNTRGVNAAEIDIFEMYGDMPSTQFTTNIHLKYPDGNVYFKRIKPRKKFSYNNSWHTYSIKWTPCSIVWYLDGREVRTLDNHGIIDPTRIIFNLAIQGNHLPKKKTPFPSVMQVDYIKVYEMKQMTLFEDCSE